MVEIVSDAASDGVPLGDGSRERFDLENGIAPLDEEKFLQPVGVRATVFSREAANEGDTAGDRTISGPALWRPGEAEANSAAAQLSQSGRIRL